MEISQAAIAAQIKRLVAERLRDSAQAILDECSSDMADPLRTRFQLAALKLYEEGGCGGLDRLAEIARQDRRDVLAWAENPGLMRAPTQLRDEHRNRIRARDRRKYIEWLNKG